MRTALLCVWLWACGGACGGASSREADTSPADTGVVADTRADSGEAGEGDAAEDGDASEVVQAECSGDLDCRLPCSDGRCEAGRCQYAGPDPRATGCLVPGADEALTCVAIAAPSPERACFFCNPFEDVVGYSAVAFSEGFESGAGRMLVEKLTPSPASWTISSARAASGERSLYFGDPALGTYDVGERAAARAVTPPLALPGELALTLSFQLFADTEETPGFDRLSVVLIPPEGEPEVVWTSDAIGGSTLGEFLPISIELGVVQNGSHLHFEADTVDEIINGFEGFYLDDVSVRSRCCDAAHGCDDGNACTSDVCADGECAHQARASCYLADVECDDGDPCSDDHCEGHDHQGGVCVSVAREGCCAAASDCGDGDPCTEDACAIDAAGAGSCQHRPICCARDADCDDGDSCTIGECLEGQCRYRSACCRQDADCDDALACTTDSCREGVCTNEFTYAAGCCIPDVLTERFDAGTPPGWVFSPPTNNIGWRVQPNAQAPSGTSVLYYGHPTLNFYESGGRNTGTATSPLMRLPDGVELRLSFQVFADIEQNAQRDLFRVEALIGQTTVVLADKSELAHASWQEISVDLSWAASQAIQIRFVFDTVDGAQNLTRGVMIDDVRLLSSCLPRRCGLDAECGSRASCIEGTCQDGVCRYGGGC